MASPSATLITCYYKVKSKHTFNEYAKWITNLLLTIKCNIIIFTSADQAEWINSLALQNRTNQEPDANFGGVKVIIKELQDLDYIFSSHCLEHVDRWVDAMDYWYSKLKIGGVLFLYLPDYSQEYWRPWNNRKHVNIFTPQIIEDYMLNRGYRSIFKSGIDLNNAFMIIGEKGD